ncbi:hypothetical protein B0J14DRAFT_562983 [Halenospora varia]|nr:hypothetical protein B0J14DRAFT_562983 [Halenospora varia]
MHSQGAKFVFVAENVAFWGMGQGCAVALTSLLTWNGESFAAFVGICGSLQFETEILEISGHLPRLTDDEELFNFFGENGGDDPSSCSDDEEANVDDEPRDSFAKIRPRPNLACRASQLSQTIIEARR